MKIRILPLLGFLFATALFGKAFALSNDALSAVSLNRPAENKTQEIVEPGAHISGETPAKNQKLETAADAKCVTGDVLIAINNKMRTLEKREAEIAQKQSAFLAIEARLNKQLKAVNAAKESLDADVKKRTAVAEADIEHLTLMYQTMKPKQAAAIFNEMDVNFAAGFLRNMKSAQAGLILSNMKAQKAYQISLIIASNNAKYR